MYIASSRCKSCAKKEEKSSNQCLFRSWRARWGGAIFSGPRTTSSGEKKVGTICSRLLNEQYSAINPSQFNCHSSHKRTGYNSKPPSPPPILKTLVFALDTLATSPIIIIFSGGMEFRGTRPISPRWFSGPKSSSLVSVVVHSPRNLGDSEL